MAKTSVPCSACGKPVYKADEFCEACGQRVDDTTKAIIQAAIEDKRRAREARAMEAERLAEQSRPKVRKAARMILVLAGLFFLGGVLQSMVARGNTEKALANLAGLDASATVPIDGVEYNVGELREQVEGEPTMVLAVNWTLTAIFVGLYFWALRAPFPAIVTAFAVFVVVHFVNFLLDPATIFQGIFIKIIGVAILAAGIQAALAIRAAEAQSRAAS